MATNASVPDPPPLPETRFETVFRILNHFRDDEVRRITARLLFLEGDRRSYQALAEGKTGVVLRIISARAISRRSVELRPAHSKDTDCTIGSDGCCTECGVSHDGTCPDCGGHGFHKPECDL